MYSRATRPPPTAPGPAAPGAGAVGGSVAAGRPLGLVVAGRLEPERLEDSLAHRLPERGAERGGSLPVARVRVRPEPAAGLGKRLARLRPQPGRMAEQRTR